MVTEGPTPGRWIRPSGDRAGPEVLTAGGKEEVARGAGQHNNAGSG